MIDFLKLITGLRIFQSRLFNIRRPLFITFCITYRCNASCDYCHRKQMMGNELESEELFRIVKKIIKAGVKRLTLTGGEPLLREELPQISRMLKNAGVYHSINTNGSLVPEKINDLKNANLITLSLDGSPEINDSLRGDGSFDRVMRAIDSMIENKIRFSITTVITEKNSSRENIDFLLDLAEKKGSMINFQTYYSLPQKKGEFHMNQEVMRKTIKYLMYRKKIGSPVGNSYGGLRALLNPALFKRRCIAGRIFARIEPDGRLINCSKAQNPVSFSLLDHDLTEAFHRLSDRIKCCGCTCYGAVELNCVYSMDLSSLYNAMIR